MDANGTRFHLFLGERDWGACREAGAPSVTLADHFRRAAEPCDASEATFAWDAASQEVTLRPCVVRFEAAPNDRPPNPAGADRRGAARDRFGNIYWIGESGTEIRVLSSGSGRAAHFWSAGEGLSCPDRPAYGEFHPAREVAPAPAWRLSGLTITDDHYLCVGVLEPAAVLVFDLHAGGPPQVLRWPAAALPFVPFDMAPRPGGGAWILDRVQRRYWALDRHFTIVPLQAAHDAETPAQLFRPVGGVAQLSTERPHTPPVGPSHAAPIAAADPIAIDALPDATVLVLDGALDDGGLARILRYRAAERLADVEWHEPFAVTPYDFVVASSASDITSPARVVIASAGGNQSFAFAVARQDGAIRVSLLADYLPMRLFGGKGLIASGDRVFYDFFDGWVSLVAQSRPRYARAAALVTPALDGREPSCVWHRLLLDACLPAEAAIEIRSRAADDAIDLELSAWHSEPSPYRRRDGSELPFAPRAEGRHATWELLFQRARGRFLQLELTFRGNGRVTPRVRALRAYYPRFSYLERYLPGVYREEPESASFLDRFLANVEGINTAIEDRIAAVQVLFDHRSAPSEVLDWLAGWFGVALDPAWTDDKRRLFIRHARTFFESRGTIAGIRAAIRLATDDCVDPAILAPPQGRRRPEGIRIVEKHRARTRPAVVAGDPTEAGGLRAVVQAPRWAPAEGGQSLSDRFRAALSAAGFDGNQPTTFPIREPADAALARHWRAFAAATLGFVPQAAAADTDAWRDFLARRYGRRSALRQAYGLSPDRDVAFEDVALPSRLPRDGAPLVDWHHFEAIVLPMRRTAHRFVVLLPVTGSVAPEPLRRERLDLVRRVVELEKPAHTIFDVKFYWALFRLGEARLGLDSLVDRGGRAPDLLPALRLGQGYLGEGHLSPAHPHDVIDRPIVGRDAVRDTGTGERHA